MGDWPTVAQRVSPKEGEGTMPSSLVRKLQLKVEQSVLVLNAPQGYVDRLAAELEGIAVAAHTEGTPDSVLLFVNSLAEAQHLAPQAIAAIDPDGLLWMAYPKGSSGVKTDVNRDRLWEAIKLLGWRAVRQIALDEVWSAIRFRPAEKVGT